MDCNWCIGFLLAMGTGIVAVSGFAMTTLHWYRAEVKARHRERGKYERLLEGRLDD